MSHETGSTLGDTRTSAAGVIRYPREQSPQEIGVPPYTDEDRREILQAIQLLRKPEGELVSEID